MATLLKYVSVEKHEIDANVTETVVALRDEVYPVEVKLHYMAFPPDCSNQHFPMIFRQLLTYPQLKKRLYMHGSPGAQLGIQDFLPELQFLRAHPHFFSPVAAELRKKITWHFTVKTSSRHGAKSATVKKSRCACSALPLPCSTWRLPAIFLRSSRPSVPTRNIKSVAAVETRITSPAAACTRTIPTKRNNHKKRQYFILRYFRLAGENLVYPLSVFTNWWQGTLNESTGKSFKLLTDGKILVYRTLKRDGE